MQISLYYILYCSQRVRQSCFDFISYRIKDESFSAKKTLSLTERQAEISPRINQKFS